jgi:hypothetical protein
MAWRPWRTPMEVEGFYTRSEGGHISTLHSFSCRDTNHNAATRSPLWTMSPANASMPVTGERTPVIQEEESR